MVLSIFVPTVSQGVLLGLSNTAGVLAGVFGTASTGYILQHGYPFVADFSFHFTHVEIKLAINFWPRHPIRTSSCKL